MNKEKQLQMEILKIYQGMSPQRTRRTVKFHLDCIQKNRDNSEDLEFHQRVLSICRKNYPLAYLLGYIDVLKARLDEYDPEIAQIYRLLEPGMENDLQEEDRLVNIFFNVSGAVDPVKLGKIIDQARDNDWSCDELIQYLERAIEEEVDNTLKNNKKYLGN